jgi:hypothetical protein
MRRSTRSVTTARAQAVAALADRERRQRAFIVWFLGRLVPQLPPAVAMVIAGMVIPDGSHEAPFEV